MRVFGISAALLATSLASGCDLAVKSEDAERRPVFDGFLQSIDGQPASSAVSLEVAATDGDRPSHYRIGLPGCTQGASSEDGHGFQPFEVLAPCTPEGLDAFLRARRVLSGPTTLVWKSGEYAELRSANGTVRFVDINAASAGR